MDYPSFVSEIRQFFRDLMKNNRIIPINVIKYTYEKVHENVRRIWE